MTSIDLDLALDVARRAAEAAGQAALAHFRAGVAVERKADRSPVTAADREAEEAILAIVRAAFPEASILAEESGAHHGDPALRWIIDPLDGTRGCYSRDGARARLSRVEDWGEATLSLGELPRLFATPAATGIAALLRSAASTRCVGDVGGAVEVLAGRAEVWLEAGVQRWDLAPMTILFDEAGGRFSDLEGGRDLSRGSAIGSNGLVHAHVLAALSLV